MKGTFNVNTHGRAATPPPEPERDAAGFPRCAIATDEFTSL